MSNILTDGGNVNRTSVRSMESAMVESTAHNTLIRLTTLELHSLAIISLIHEHTTTNRIEHTTSHQPMRKATCARASAHAAYACYDTLPFCSICMIIALTQHVNGLSYTHYPSTFIQTTTRIHKLYKREPTINRHTHKHPPSNNSTIDGWASANSLKEALTQICDHTTAIIHSLVF